MAAFKGGGVCAGRARSCSVASEQNIAGVERWHLSVERHGTVDGWTEACLTKEEEEGA